MANEADPHTHVRATSQPCLFHSRHLPSSHVNHIHHVWPLGDGGPDIPDNKVVICATGHYNVHELLQHFKMLMGNVSYTILRQYTVEERKLAKLGYKRITRKEM